MHRMISGFVQKENFYFVQNNFISTLHDPKTTNYKAMEFKIVLCNSCFIDYKESSVSDGSTTIDPTTSRLYLWLSGRSICQT